jgi:hypothetical protein
MTIKFYVEWPGERAAGIRGGSEHVSISFEYGTVIDSDTVEFFRESLREFFDCRKVQTWEEAEKEWKAREEGMRETEGAQ